MFKGVHREQITVKAHKDYLGGLRDFVKKMGEKYGYPSKMIHHLTLAVDEAATNIIRHAYRERDGEITIRAVMKRDSFTIALIDQGDYFDPRRVQAPDLHRYVDIGKKGGLGIYTIRKVIDEIDYRKTDEGNELRMTKYREKPSVKKSLLRRMGGLPHSFKAIYFLRTIAVLTLLILGVYIYYFARADDHVMEAFLTSSRSLTNQVVNRIATTTPEALTFIEPVAQPIFEEFNDQVYAISIEDTTGSVIWSPEPDEWYQPFRRPAEYVEVEEGVYEYTLDDGTRVFEFEKPIVIRSTGRPFGEAHVLFAARPVYAEIRAVRMNDLRLTLLILGLSYFGVAALIYVVMIPFRKLADWVKDLGQGDIEEEMDIDGSTEIGEIAQAFSDITHKFRESQKNLAEQERLQKEMQVAREIQQTLLPYEFPELEGYELASFYEAAKQVGGDYYGFIEVDADTLGIAVADVSGKGVPGSLIMAMIHQTLKTEARGVKDAAEVLARVNDYVINDMKKGMFVTIFYLIIDSKKRRINYASAGHNPMILYRNSTKQTYYLNPKGFPLGIQLPEKDMFRNYIESDTIQLAQDDILLIYTDGITEAMNRRRELFGEERLLKVLRQYGHHPVVPFVEKLKDSIHSFTEGSPQYDDITLVAIRETSSPQKDELRRAKEAHKMIAEGMSIREACETVGITTYAYYNKYKHTFEQEGIEAFEIDEEISVEAKHLSIEEKTKILDIIAAHPEYGAGRISEELNTEKYGFTKISESKIYDELVRSRLNTRQLREAYVARGQRDRRRLKPPGTPLLTLDGKIILDREDALPDDAASEKRRPPSRITQQRDESDQDSVESKPEAEASSDEELSQKFRDADAEADNLIGSPLEELLASDRNFDFDGGKTADGSKNGRDTGSEDEEGLKGPEDSSDLMDESPEQGEDLSDVLHEENYEEDDSGPPEVDHDLSFEELASDSDFMTEEDPESSDIEETEDERSFVEEISENGGGDEAHEVDEEDDINLDFLQDEDQEDATEADERDEESEATDLTASSLDELLGEGDAGPWGDSSEIERHEEVEDEADEESFSDFISALDEDVSKLTEEPSEASEEPPQTNRKQATDRQPQDTRESQATQQRLDARERLLKNGIKYYKNRNYDKAIEEFKKVIGLHPDFKVAHSLLGNAYFRNKMFEQAATTYGRVKQLDPNDVTAYENMGVIYANRGQYQEAIREWQKVLELNAPRPDIEKKIAKARQML